MHLAIAVLFSSQYDVLLTLYYAIDFLVEICDRERCQLNAQPHIIFDNGIEMVSSATRTIIWPTCMPHYEPDIKRQMIIFVRKENVTLLMVGEHGHPLVLDDVG